MKQLKWYEEINWTIVAIVIGLIVLYFFFGSIKNAIQNLFGYGSEHGGRDAERDTAEGGISNPNIWNLSKDKDELKRRTSVIFDAMNRIGTKEKDIINSLQGLNADDIKYIQEQFGVKDYNGWTVATKLDKIAGVGVKSLNVNGWLRAELSGSDLETVRNIYNNVGLTL